MKAGDLLAAFDSLPAAWQALAPHWDSARVVSLIQAIEAVSAQRDIGPDDPFRALRLVAPDEVRVVILGQDPYPTPGHADGLAFSAGHGKPASLRRIMAVLAQDRPGFVPPPVWKLDDWARQGVLLLNPVLTVELGEAGSHLGCGWQAFTAALLAGLVQRGDPPAFLLWGAKAQAFFETVPGWADPRLQVLRTRHPSHDFHRTFMAEGSHFLATADRVDWWRIGTASSKPVL